MIVIPQLILTWDTRVGFKIVNISAYHEKWGKIHATTHKDKGVMGPTKPITHLVSNKSKTQVNSKSQATSPFKSSLSYAKPYYDLDISPTMQATQVVHNVLINVNLETPTNTSSLSLEKVKNNTNLE